MIGEDLDPKDQNNIMLDEYAEICRKEAKDTGSQLLDLRKKIVSYLKKHNKDNLSKSVLTYDKVHMNSAGNGFIAKFMLEALNIPAKDSFKKKKEKLAIYICIGQSNMAGRAPILGKDTNRLDRAYLLDFQDKWIPANNPMNRYSTIRKDFKMQKMSPTYSFAKEMVSFQRKPIGLIVNAKGGSKIENWMPGEHFYNEVIRRVNQVKNKGALKGVIWHQGESNYQDENYLEKLVEFIESLRKDLGNDNLPFIAGQINGVGLINKQVKELPNKLSNTAYVSSEGLVVQDKWHFDNSSAIKLGQVYAKKMMQLINK